MAHHKIKPRTPCFPHDHSPLPTQVRELQNSYRLEIWSSSVGRLSFKGHVVAQKADGEWRRYLFEASADRARKVNVTLSTANPENPSSFSNRDGLDKPIRELKGVAPGYLRELKVRIQNTVEYELESYLVEQKFLESQFNESSSIIGATSSYDNRNLEVRRVGEWLIYRATVNGINHHTEYSAHSLQKEDTMSEALTELSKNKNRKPPKYDPYETTEETSE